jgi:beta-aspartyl-peptidase (threonine type)
MIRFALHGGAGELHADADTREQRAVLRRVGEQALAALRKGASALEVVEAAVVAMEDCPLFNAGTGATLTADGVPELDAAIMDGSDRRCGALTGVSRLANPVRVARRMLEHGPHVFMSGAGAERYAESQGFTLIDPQTLIIAERERQLAAAKRTGSILLDHDTKLEGLEGTPPPDAASTDSAAFGTVGAVARDANGRLAAATSTGGLTNKLPGRIGDSPVPGAGTYADNRSVAISCTGTGESFIRACFGHTVHAQVLYASRPLADACAQTLADLGTLHGRGGCIAIDRDGHVVTPFNSTAMFRAWAGADGRLYVAVGDDDAD